MIFVDYHGFKSWTVNQNYTASTVDNFQAIVYNGVAVVTNSEPQVIKLERRRHG
jgi:hypothetical protein